MKTIALSGGTGFIGQYLIREVCLTDNWYVRCLSSKNEFSRYFSDEHVEYIHCETDLNSLNRRFAGCDAVVHLGSVVPDPAMKAEQMASECLENIQYASNVLEACRNQGIRNVVFASSISVYDNRRREPCTETQRCDPQTLYGVTKLAIEKLAGLYNNLYDMRIKSLRISQVFGARRTIKRPVLKMLYDNCRNGVPITVFGTGTTAQDYIYVKDVARAFIMALLHENIAGEFNIGMGREISVNELAEAYSRAFKNSAGIVHDPSKTEKVIHWSIDTQKAETVLGFEPTYTLETACADMARVYQEDNFLP